MFDPKKPVNGTASKHNQRPTVVCLVTMPGIGNTQLLLVLPRNAEPHGWSFPQGEIHHGESPLEAALRELNEECGYEPKHFWLDASRALCEGESTVRALMVKRYFVVGLRLRQATLPRLNRENRHFLFAGGPHFVWSHIGDCSEGKQRLIAASLVAAVSDKLLCGRRWAPDRLAQFVHFVGGR